MSADEMLRILAAADPSAAFRAWAKTRHPSELFDDNLDSATPIDLDPLRRYDLHSTFLHRVRRRARIFSQMRANLQKPVWGVHALEWRLHGIVGIEALAERFMRELRSADGMMEECLLTLSDFLIVLREVDYQPDDGALPKGDFDKIYRSFLKSLAGKLDVEVAIYLETISEDMGHFWKRVVDKCRG